MIWPPVKPFKYNHFTTYTSYNAKFTTEQITGFPCALHLLLFALRALVGGGDGLNCRSINEEAVQHFLSSLSVNFSKPDALLVWLETNDASYLTALHVHLDAYDKAPSAAHWSRLFEQVGREATNLQHLSVYWDHDGYLH